jgi:hypothetical protein
VPQTSPPSGSNPSLAVDVSVIQETGVPPPTNEPDAIAEKQQFERQTRALTLEDLRNDVTARRRFARHIFNFMVIWMAIVVGLVLANAISIPAMHNYATFHLSDAVLITLVSTTTGTVIGVFLIVAKYLYRAKDSG